MSSDCDIDDYPISTKHHELDLQTFQKIPRPEDEVLCTYLLPTHEYLHVGSRCGNP